jgi:hypothetical protein
MIIVVVTIFVASAVAVCCINSALDALCTCLCLLVCLLVVGIMHAVSAATLLIVHMLERLVKNELVEERNQCG